MKKYMWLFTVSVFLYFTVNAQDSSANTIILKEASRRFQISQKNKSGQEKDIWPNLFQMAAKNIFGDDGELSFSSTLFGLADSIRRNIEVDTIFRRLQWARNISFSLAGKMDSSSRIATFGGGINFAIINKRDMNLKDKYFNDVMAKIEDRIAGTRARLEDMLTENKSESDKEKINKEINSKFSAFRKSGKAEDIGDLYLKILKDSFSITDPKTFFFEANELYNSWQEDLKTKPIWTLGFNYMRNTILKSDTSKIKSEFLAGIKQKARSSGKMRKPWELNVSSFLNLYKNADSTEGKKMAMPFHIEAGLNKILLHDDEDASQMELKFFASFDKDLSNSRQKGILMANATYRYRVFGDFWVPVTISYDPKDGTVFGFASLTFNLDKYSKSKNQQ